MARRTATTFFVNKLRRFSVGFVFVTETKRNIVVAPFTFLCGSLFLANDLASNNPHILPK